MEKVAEFLINKIGYTLSVILFFGLPGIVFVFVWNREIFVSVDVFKLIILSFAISFMLYIPTFIIISSFLRLEEKTRGKEFKVSEMLLVSMAINVVIMVVGIICKLEKSNFTIQEFLREYVKVAMVYVVIKVIVEGIYYLLHRGWRRK